MLVDIVSNTFEFLTIVQHALRGSEFRVRSFMDTHSAVRAQFGQQPSLMLVDLLLTEIDSVQFIKWMRQKYDRLPLAVVSLTQPIGHEEIHAFKAGADDFITDPMPGLVFIARIRALMRRIAETTVHEGAFPFGPFHFDCDGRRLLCRGEAVSLTEKEYDLILMLARYLGRPVSRGMLINQIFAKPENDLTSRSLVAYIHRLRGKLSLHASSGVYIHSVYRVGYRLTCPTG